MSPGENRSLARCFTEIANHLEGALGVIEVFGELALSNPAVEENPEVALEIVTELQKAGMHRAGTVPAIREAAAEYARAGAL